MKKEKNSKPESKPKSEFSKMKIPNDVQKQMLEFFMHTSIPRKKAKEKHLPEQETDR